MSTRLVTTFGYLLTLAFCGLVLYLVFVDHKTDKQVQNVVITPTEYQTPTPFNLNSDKIFNLVNNWRQEHGYKRLLLDQTLCNIATKRLPEIKISRSHDGFWKYSKTYPMMGENLAEDYYFENAVLDAWIKSPEHLANLERPFIYSCIETDGQYVVQEFASF